MSQQARQLQLSMARRGSGLLDGLIALALLAFGMLTMSRLQSRVVTQATDSQARQVATQLSAELMATVLVDAANAACYTLPQAGTCTNAAAIARTAAWATRVGAGLPGTVSAASVLDNATGRLTVTLSWTDRDAGTARSLETVTDVRP